jgi:hypothetical protein
MHELELYCEAMKLRKQHGSRARLQASLQSSRALALGNLNEQDHWDKVRSVVGYLEQIEQQSAA